MPKPPLKAVISGATHGIGKAISKKLLQNGASIAICSRNQNDLDALKREWQEQFPSAIIFAIAADLSNVKEVNAFVAALKNEFSDLQILVNNAGIFQPGSIATEPAGQLETMLGVNLLSAYHLTRALLPWMNKGAHIFNMCSVASLKAYPDGGSYSISKYALLGFSENLREELKPRGIKVTNINPGATWSRSWSNSGVSPERIMEADDIAKMLWAAFDLSAQANVENITLRPVLGDL